MSGLAGWSELRLPVDPSAQDAVVLQLLRPLVAASVPVFMLRDQQAKLSSLRIWVHQERPGKLPDELAAAVETTGATVLPGSSFTGDDSPYAGPRIAAFWHGLLSEAAPLMVSQVAEVVAGKRSRLSLALDAMISHLPAVDFAKVFSGRYPAAATEFDFPVPFPALRSHSDGIIVMSRDPAAARAELDAKYAPFAAGIERRVSAILGQLDGTGPAVSEDALQWYELAGKYLRLADAELTSGGITIVWEEGWVGDAWDLSPSPFHQVVQSSSAFQDFLRADSGYQAMRIMMTALYLYLNMLGLRIVDRFFACHAISRACESVFGVDATTVMSGFTGVFAETPMEHSAE